MKTAPAKLLDTVAVLEDQPAKRLVAVQVGAIVALLGPDVFNVEF